MQIYALTLRSFACSLPVESFFWHWYWRCEFWRSSNWRVYQFPPAVTHWAIQSRCFIKVRGKKKHLRKFVMQPVDEFVDSNITLFAVWLKNLNTRVQNDLATIYLTPSYIDRNHDLEIVKAKNEGNYSCKC